MAITCGDQSAKDFDFGLSTSDHAKAAKAPYEVVYEDENILAYIKPAGMVFASPKPQVKTSFTAMKIWMTKARPKCECIQFVNRIEKESSGISIIAKNLVWRKHLQEQWQQFQRRMYVLVEGHLPADDVLFCFNQEEGKKKRTKHEFAYRTMRATPVHTLLKMQAGFEHVPLLMNGLRRQQCLLLGKGNEMPDPLGRSGLHLFGVDLVGPEGENINVKSRVPQGFLNLMKGGKGPKAEPNWKRNQRSGEVREKPRSEQRRLSSNSNRSERSLSVEKKKSTGEGAFFSVWLKLVPVLKPIPEFNGILRAQITECYSHCSSNHDWLSMHVANERFILLECTW